MAHEVIEEQEEPEAKPKPQVVKEFVTHFAKYQLPPFIDSLVLLVIAFWYFFFTGLAILFRANIPRDWLKIATYLSKGKIAKKVQDMAEAQEVKVKKPVRIVDLETKEDIFATN